MSQFQIRPMQVEDIDAVHQVETLSFTTPWSKEAFYQELTGNPLAFYTVITVDDQVVGYGGMWVIIDEAHVTNIAIHPDFRGKKLGYHLLVQMMAYAYMRGARRMTLEVRLSNQIAQRLYTKMGFESYGVRKHYYEDNGEDALIMWANLEDQLRQEMSEEE
ncbi:ribosomal protein S18-alanine N-acetyltransferase [Rubeoparvulum massiliense]|uniref:ribosomal protein S18-alanine N-acetyltransferase n=1 Tax=Rubeoparvulum massiliense TaxID=1631346 RepID=UPI00065DFE3C|nr:ribosomal protein S18-alanine N-acetyltransferase [Rubeoparvulum massiliense]